MRASIWVIVFLAISLSASAATYDFYGGMPLHLGAGFDPTDFATAYAPCLDFDNEIPLDVKKGVSESVGMETDFTLNQVTSRRQLYRYLSISASVSGHYALFQGSGGIDLEEEDTFDSDNFTWIVRVYTKYGKFGMEKPRLNKEAERLKDDPVLFRTRCGYEYVSQVNRGVLAAIVYTVKNLSESSKSRLEAKFKADLAGGTWGVSTSVDYQRFIQQALQFGSIELKVFTIGGAGAPSIAELEKNTADITKIKETLANYTTDQGTAKSAPLSFVSGSLAQFNPRLGFIDYGYYTQVLDDLSNLQIEYRARARRIHAYLLNQRDFLTDSQVESGATDEKFRKIYKVLVEKIADINKSAMACRIYITQLAQTAATFPNGKGSRSGGASLIESRSLNIKTEVSTAEKPFSSRSPHWSDRSQSSGSPSRPTKEDCTVPIPIPDLALFDLPPERPFRLEYSYEPMSDPSGSQLPLIWRLIGPSIQNVYVRDKNNNTVEIVLPVASGDQKIASGAIDTAPLKRDGLLPLTMEVSLRSGRTESMSVPLP
jgi:hypothetical protein